MPQMKILLSLASIVLALAGCPKPKPQLDPDKTKEGKLIEPPGPRYPAEPGKQSLREAALACYRGGLRRRPQVFGKGGHIVISWTADRRGDLLRLHFEADSFRGWEVNRSGESLADCVVRRARGAKVLWSRRGVAPLRFAPSGPSSAPSGAPATAPALSPAEETR